ncbi:hypothetical protein RHSIM_Rhsim10G0077700 [Rhododendron simsii]|uniref:Uncharacterized protein n=1 Tax=Rhododendron simsii TaxID=118357 RepID=A0A834G8Y8_RHOSS|nr:hypothetical protein RHSIM_Rhsim10G0077700 [Rhododendron simsii]
MSPFLRYFPESYNLAPIQVSVNNWRILCSAMRLARVNNLPFDLGDLMLMYVVSRNPTYDKYYLTTRQWEGATVARPYNIPRVWGFLGDGDVPDCSAPTKRLYLTGRQSHSAGEEANQRVKKRAKVAEDEVEITEVGHDLSI